MRPCYNTDGNAFTKTRSENNPEINQNPKVCNHIYHINGEKRCNIYNLSKINPYLFYSTHNPQFKPIKLYSHVKSPFKLLNFSISYSSQINLALKTKSIKIWSLLKDIPPSPVGGRTSPWRSCQTTGGRLDNGNDPHLTQSLFTMPYYTSRWLPLTRADSTTDHYYKYNTFNWYFK